MDNYVTLYLVRHGQTEWNVKEIFQGQDDSPLTETGLHQAHEIGELFKTTEFDAVYSSDMGRAKATAEIIAQHHHLKVNDTPLIRERYFGKYQGMQKDEVHRILQAKYDQSRDLSKEEMLTFQLDEDIETDAVMMRRLYEFFSQIANSHGEQKVLTVTHGALMRAFLIYIDFARYGQLDFYSIDNLGYFIIHTNGKNVRLLRASGIHLRK